MKIHLIIIVFLIESFSVFGQWVQKSSLGPSERQNAACFTIADKAYIGLGQSSNGTKLYDFWEYNTLTDTWTKIADYPGTGSYAATAFAINGKGYVCLGFSSSNLCQKDLWEYSPATNTWARKTDFSGIARYGASSFVVGDTAYVGTGSYNNSTDFLFDMWQYVPANDKWTQIEDFPGGKRSHATAFSIAKNGYMGVGLSDNTTLKSDFWRYNHNDSSWSSITDFPNPARGASISFVIENKAFIGTGCEYLFNDFNNVSNFYRYNPETNLWDTNIAIPQNISKRRYAIGFSVNSIGYFGFGYSDLETPYVLSDLWSIDALKTSNVISGTDQIKSDFNFTAFPNPSQSTISIKLNNNESESFNMTIYSIDGKAVLNKNININHIYKLYISNISSGVYYLTLKNEERSLTRKIIKM